MKHLNVMKWPSSPIRHACVASLLLALSLQTSCSRDGDKKPEDAKTNNTAATKPATAPAITPAAATAGTPPELDADPDKAWKQAQEVLKAPPKPEEWKNSEPSEEEIRKYNVRMADSAAKGADLLRQFYLKFPKHARADTARRREVDLLRVATEHQPALADRLKQTEKEFEASSAGVEDKAIQKRLGDIQAAAYKVKDNGEDAMFQAYVEGATAMQKEFPNSEVPNEILLELIQMATRDGSESGLKKAQPLIDAVVKGNASDELKEHAQMMTRRFTFVGKTIDVKFKAVDGREVDFSKWRGKVVLIDFWASWCRPCMMEMPRLKEAYEKWHGKGLEVVGISLDQNKTEMDRAISRTGIPWPIHFEANGEQNRFAKEFGIMPIPEFWLIDKKGVLRNREARANLEEEIEKLIAEKDPS